MTPTRTPPLSAATLAYGERMMTALLGVDALYRAESGDETGLAVLNMDTEGRFAPDGFGTYAEARRHMAALLREAAALPEPDRQVYYRDACQSTLAFLTWRTDGLAFTEQLHQFLHVPAAPAADRELDDLRGQMQAVLTRLGYAGDLRAQCAAWEARHRVAAADVPGVLAGMMDEAWDRTEADLLSIPADKSDGMQVVPVSGVSYNARCDYLARRVELNTDPILTRPGLKHLTVHEGYPGHYVQFKLRETLFRQGTAAADGLLSVVNTASSSVFEGIADAGMEMLGWIADDDDRFQGLMNRYRAGIGTGAAWRLHALGWASDRVAEWLRGQSLAGGEGWVQNRMGFIAAPARAVLIWSYWWGEPVVAAAWRAATHHAPTDRPAFLEFLYGRMHSNASVALFN